MRKIMTWSTVLNLATAVTAAAAEPKLDTEEQKTLYALGLTISRRGVEACGGRIRVRDVPGKGCIFTVDLPREPPPSV